MNMAAESTCFRAGPAWKIVGISAAMKEGLLNRSDGYQARMAAANDHFSEYGVDKEVADAIREVRKEKKY
ncbi:MAG: hypothetical protein NTZ26_01455 [Candidatus Aminicenantes bacterium]|nr:hypothetical protein [Candidatus Aminicenantes bacterium]